ncbi:unnamed protein product, partial [Mesorhabditis spiculigera]
MRFYFCILLLILVSTTVAIKPIVDVTDGPAIGVPRCRNQAECSGNMNCCAHPISCPRPALCLFVLTGQCRNECEVGEIVLGAAVAAQ